MLISILSFAASPLVPVRLILSDPARSTNCSVLVMTFSTLAGSTHSQVRVKIACDLLEAWFRLCEATILFLMPKWNNSMTSSSFEHSKINRFSTINWSFLFHRILSPFVLFLALRLERLRRSNTFSLYICRKETYQVICFPCFSFLCLIC